MGTAVDRVLASVFPHREYTTSTPEVTPVIGSVASPTESFAAFDDGFDISTDQIVFNRAWSTVTRYLTLQPGINQIHLRSPNDYERNAFSVILASESSRKELLSWLLNEIKVHYRDVTRPLLSAWDGVVVEADAVHLVRETIKTLKMAQTDRYLAAIEELCATTQASHTTSAVFFADVQVGLHNIVLHSFPPERLQPMLTRMLFYDLVSLVDHGNGQINLEEMRQVGLNGPVVERAFAHAVSEYLQGPAIERPAFAVDWTGRSSVISKLKVWMEQRLSPVVHRMLAALTGKVDITMSLNATWLTSMATSNLGRSRTLNIFDYVKSWPSSTGAILDIREYLIAGSSMDKIYVCQCFSDQVQRRVLHAGASTSDILSVYVNVIHVFRTLDSRGVLLGKVALPIRSYLRSREDTVNIIAASFLADATSSSASHICPSITMEVVDSTLASDGETTLNWDDMHWLPDPVDAGPDYKSSQSEDVIAYILGLFDPEEFIKEVTAVLARHLLASTDAEYVKETRLVELFKSRLDASKLQAAEVMLKDMRDSVTIGKRINPSANYDEHPGPEAPLTPREIQAAIPDEGITLSSLFQAFDGRMKRPQFMAAVKLVAIKRNDLYFAKRTRIPANAPNNSSDSRKGDGDSNFRAHVLSSFFWPQLRSDDFDIPLALGAFETFYEDRFNALGSQRRLHFRPALARASIRLDLEDRRVEEHDVTGWGASVIDAFSSERLQGSGLRIEELCQMLRMDEQLAQDALNFWTSRNVLYQPEPGLYAVLERLDMERGTSASHVAAPPQESISAVVSQDAMLKESAPTFAAFITNMLRNQGPKQIGGIMGITGLLRMVMPTFSYGDDEVAWILGEMEAKGEVVRDGDVWSIAN